MQPSTPTPVVRLTRLAPADGASVHLKLEHLSLGASTQDRVARAWLARASAGSRSVVVATTGSLGISLALLGSARGWAVTAVISDAMTLERRATLRLYGAKVELVPEEQGWAAVEARAAELARERGATLLNPFDFPGAAEVHQSETGAELVEAAKAEGGLDALVCGTGTGATLAGLARAVRGAFPRARVVQVRPAAARHRIQGLFHAPARSLLGDVRPDEVIDVGDAEAWATRGRLGAEEGLLLGISSGANVAAALSVARRLPAGQRVYTVAIDTGERYFSLGEQFK